MALKPYGDDFNILTSQSEQIVGVLQSIEGSADVMGEQLTGQPVLQIEVDQNAIARHGIPARTVLDLIESLGSKEVGEVVEGQLHFPLTIRDFCPIDSAPAQESIASIMVAAPNGERIPLGKLTHIHETEGPSTITRRMGPAANNDSGQRARARSGSFVAEAQRRIRCRS